MGERAPCHCYVTENGAGGRDGMTTVDANRPGGRPRLSKSKRIICYLNTYQVVPWNHLPKCPLTDE